MRSAARRSSFAVAPAWRSPSSPTRNTARSSAGRSSHRSRPRGRTAISGHVNILLFGKTGALGSELERLLAGLGAVTAPGREAVELEDLTSVRAAVRGAAPDVIVNAAAYTDVDQAESDADRAQRV